MAHRRTNKALEGLRALAMLAVLIYHANPTWLPGGYLGVTVFFVLTGYLATVSAEKLLAHGGMREIPHLLLRRISRIWAPAVATVGVTCALCALFAQPLLVKALGDAPWAVLLVSNISYVVREVSYFAASGLPSPLTHLWYLGVAAQFHLVWPFVLLLIARITRTRHQAAGVIAGLTLASTLAAALLLDPSGDTTRVYYLLDTRGAELLVGALLAVWTGGEPFNVASLKKRGIPVWTADVLALGALLVIGVLAFTLDGYSLIPWRGGFLLVALLVAGILYITANPRQSILARILGSKPLEYIGSRSFSVYLWHYPLLLIMNPATRTTALPWWGWLLELIVIALVSEVSWRVLENPRKNGVVSGVALKVRTGLVVAGVIAALLPLVWMPPTPTGADAGQGEDVAAFDPMTQTYDMSGTYLKNTGLAKAIDSINSMSFDVDVETGATDADVLLIGDSVPAGAEAQFKRIFPKGHIDAKVGRQLTAGVDVYNSCVAAGYNGNVVVWSIGDNGVARDDQVRELINVCGDKRVYLVTVRVPLALQDLNNETFRRIASEYPNVSVIDWYAESAGHDEWFWNDGTHLRPEGAEAYVMMLRRAITGR